jgi:hypothetical protein
MNSGELKDRIEVLALSKVDNTYCWITVLGVWAKTERLKNTNIFSKVGIGAKSVQFTIRKRELTLHNALRWKGKHCFLTDIVETADRMYYEVTAALIEPKTCTVKRTGEPTFNKLNRPVYGEPTILTFPGCLTEKYLGYEQGKPMATTEIRYVLVTPKAVELTSGELVSIGNKTYTVEMPHTLDDYKNDYEISVRSDA